MAIAYYLSLILINLEKMPKHKEFIFREFLPTDIAGALDLWSSVDGMGLTESDTPEKIGLFLARNPGLSAVAISDNGEVIGALLCGHNGRAGSLYHLAVSACARGKGIGHRLVEFCLARLAELDIPRCNIFVYNDNEEGNRFWLGSGWIDPATWRVLQIRLS
ncbi:GNAT family N-acetyltransferase (plasmid) [Cupriavidus metallidurans]|uniref:GNAT family N-acetyltransferase n=1 Tax=Cupriavidus metallidurans TaxID=119219 RepID=UPI003D75041C